MSKVLEILKKEALLDAGREYFTLDGITEALLELEKQIIELNYLLSEKIVYKVPLKEFEDLK